MSWIILVLLGNITTAVSLAVTVVYCAYKLKGWRKMLIATLIVIVMSESAITLAIMKINIAQDPQSPIALYFYILIVNPVAFVLLMIIYNVIYGIEWLFFTRKILTGEQGRDQKRQEPKRHCFPIILRNNKDKGQKRGKKKGSR